MLISTATSQQRGKLWDAEVKEREKEKEKAAKVRGKVTKEHYAYKKEDRKTNKIQQRNTEANGASL